MHICAYFSAFLAKKCAYICAYFLHFSVHIIRALHVTINPVNKTNPNPLKKYGNMFINCYLSYLQLLDTQRNILWMCRWNYVSLLQQFSLVEWHKTEPRNHLTLKILINNLILINFYPVAMTSLSSNFIGFAISIETPPVDCQFGNAANMFSNFWTIIANLDFC
jgi:hypothetical protein